MIIGITRNTKIEHIVRPTLESIAYQTKDAIEAMERDMNTSIKELRVDECAAKNNWLVRLQADILGKRVIRPVVFETTALGAAYLAGLAIGYWEDLRELLMLWRVDKFLNHEYLVIQEKNYIRDGNAQWKEVWMGEKIRGIIDDYLPTLKRYLGLFLFLFH